MFDKDIEDGSDLVRDVAKIKAAGDRCAGFGRAEDLPDVPRGVAGDRLAAFEAKSAAGFVKVGGKHIKADGLVSKRGNRRIIPAGYEEDKMLVEDRIERLATATKVLHGRNATVFEKLYLNPLQGKRKATAEELAKQFGVEVRQIYKIAERAKERVTEEVKRLQSAKAGAIEPRRARWTHPLDPPPCPHCGGIDPVECIKSLGWCSSKNFDKVPPECVQRFDEWGRWNAAVAKALAEKSEREREAENKLRKKEFEQSFPPWATYLRNPAYSIADLRRIQDFGRFLYTLKSY